MFNFKRTNEFLKCKRLSLTVALEMDFVLKNHLVKRNKEANSIFDAL